jgi:hypothetical protein
MVYQDFDLLIDRSGEGLRAQVLNSPAGQATAEFRLPFTEDKLENYLLRLGRTRPATRRVESQEMNTAKAFGAALFDAVFSGDVKACFRSSIDEVRRHNAGLRIRLRLGDPSVADLPWEFLYNRSVNRFIALSVHTPLVRYMDLPERIQPIAVKPPIRVLVMISSPSDFPSLDVEAEWTRLNEALKGRIDAGQLAIERLEVASLETLQHRLRRRSYHIFHFIGHGEFDQERQEGVLILEAGNKRGHKVDGQFLGMLLHDHESLRVAILNACEGARTSRTDPFAGSAQSLVQQGIPAVIAMQFEIADDVASRFAHEFYGALADGYPIDASLTEARKSIFAAGREVEWGTPVLYLRAPDGRIFDIEATRPPTRPPIDSSPKVIESANNLEQDRVADAIVAAAQEAFAGGQRLQALDMLRRYDPARGGIGEALRKLTAEHQRLIDEGSRATRRKIDEHLRQAGALLARGQLSEAWGHACDALQIDSTDRNAVALEGRIRKALDEQTARDHAREQEEARRAQEARAREIERANLRARLRGSIERAIAAGDLDSAERELERADQAHDPGPDFADLRTRVAELRREEERRQERLADEAIERARREFAGNPSGAVELLKRFSPPHARVTSTLRELRDLVAKQIDQDLREAERRRGAERIRDADRLRDSRPDLQTPPPRPRRDIVQAISQPRVLWTAAAVFIVAAAALWLVPHMFNKTSVSPPTTGQGAAAGDVTRPSPPRTTSVPPATPQPSPVVGVAPEAPPPASEAAATGPEVPSAPPAAATKAAPVNAGVPDAKTVADYRTRVQALILKKEPEQALATLTDAFAYAPRDKGLRALGVKVADQAQDKAVQERSRAVAQGASGLATFKQADRTRQRARTLSQQGNTAASARAYLDAADLFGRSAAESTKKRGAGRSARGNVDEPAPEAPEPEPTATPPAPRADPPAIRPAVPLPPPDPAIAAYAAALTRGEQAALLAVFPGAPPEVLTRLTRRAPGYTLRIQIERQLREADRRWLVWCTFIHESTTSGIRREVARERHYLELELTGQSLTLVKDQVL